MSEPWEDFGGAASAVEEGPWSEFQAEAKPERPIGPETGRVTLPVPPTMAGISPMPAPQVKPVTVTTRGGLRFEWPDQMLALPRLVEPPQASAAEKIAVAPLNVVPGVANYVLSPEGMGMTLAATQPYLAPAVYGKWAYDMLRGGYENIKDATQRVAGLIRDDVNRRIVSANRLGPMPPAPKEDDIQALAEDAVNTALMGLGGAGAGRMAVRKGAALFPERPVTPPEGPGPVRYNVLGQEMPARPRVEPPPVQGPPLPRPGVLRQMQQPPRLPKPAVPVFPEPEVLPAVPEAPKAAPELAGWDDFVAALQERGTGTESIDEIRAMFPQVAAMPRESARELGRAAFGEGWNPAPWAETMPAEGGGLSPEAQVNLREQLKHIGGQLAAEAEELRKARQGPEPLEMRVEPKPPVEPKPELPRLKEMLEPTVPEGPPAEPYQTVLQEIRDANARTIREIQGLFPKSQMNREQARLLRNAAWGAPEAPPEPPGRPAQPPTEPPPPPEPPEAGGGLPAPKPAPKPGPIAPGAQGVIRSQPPTPPKPDLKGPDPLKTADPSVQDIVDWSPGQLNQWIKAFKKWGPEEMMRMAGKVRPEDLPRLMALRDQLRAEIAQHVQAAEALAMQKNPSWEMEVAEGNGKELKAQTLNELIENAPKAVGAAPAPAARPPLAAAAAAPAATKAAGGRDWELFAENLGDALDVFAPARETGKIDYDLQDAAARFVEYAKKDTTGRPLDSLVADFAKVDKASGTQLRKLRTAVKDLLAEEGKAAAGKGPAVPAPAAPGTKYPKYLNAKGPENPEAMTKEAYVEAWLKAIPEGEKMPNGLTSTRKFWEEGHHDAIENILRGRLTGIGADAVTPEALAAWPDLQELAAKKKGKAAKPAPTLQGKALVDAARKLLGIPEKKVEPVRQGAPVAPPEVEGPAAAPTAKAKVVAPPGTRIAKDALGKEFVDISPTSPRLEELRAQREDLAGKIRARKEQIRQLWKQADALGERGKVAEQKAVIEQHDALVKEDHAAVDQLRDLDNAISDERRQVEWAPFRGLPPVKGHAPTITGKQLKGQKENLLEQVSAAIKKAPAKAKEVKEGEPVDTVHFAVPGDGEWTIPNNKPALQGFQEKVKKEFPSGVTRQDLERGLGPSRGKAMPKAVAPDPEDVPKLGAAVVSKDESRYSIQTAYADGTQIVSTDGRQLLRVVDPAAPGAVDKPVRLDAEGKVTESDSNYPNYNQVIPSKPDLVYGGLKSDELWHVARQAQAFKAGIDPEKQPALQLFVNPNGSLAARMEHPETGEFQYNLQKGAKRLGNYNADYVFGAADVARKLGNERVDLYADGKDGPLEIVGRNHQHLIMGIRTEGTAGDLRDAPSSFRPGQAVHVRPAPGLGPLRDPETPLHGGTITTKDGKFAASLSHGEIKLEKWSPYSWKPESGEWVESGKMSREEFAALDRGAREQAMAKLAGATEEKKVSNAAAVSLTDAVQNLMREREGIIEEGKKRLAAPEAGLAERAVKALEAEADKARARLKSQRQKGVGGELGALSTAQRELKNIRDFAIIGAAKLARGTLDFARWSKAMMDELGTWIKPHLPAIYAASQQELQRYRAEGARLAGERAKPTSVQEVINASTGVKSQPAGTLTNVLEALRTGLRTVRALQDFFAGGPKVSRAEVRQADAWLEADANRIKESLSELARRELPLSERGRFLTAINNATERAPILGGDPAGMYRRAARVAARIQDRAVEVRKENAIGRLKAVVARALESTGVDIGYKKRILEVMSRVSFTKPTEATVAALKATREYLDRMAAAGKNVDMPKEVLDQLEVLAKTPIREMSPEAVEALLQKIEALEKLGRLKVQARGRAWEIEKEGKLKELAGEVTRPLEQRPELRGQPGEPKSFTLRLRNMLNARLNMASLVDKALMPIDALFDMLGDNKGAYRGWLFRHVRGPVDLGFNAAQVLRDRLEEPVLKILREHKMGDVEAERIGVYAIAMQEGGVERLVEMGVKPETIEKIMRTLNPAEKRVYLEMRKALDSMLPDIQKLMHELYNIDVKPVENYFPMPRDWTLIEEDVKVPAAPKFGTDFSYDELGGWKAMMGDYRSPRTTKTERGFTIERRPKAKTAIQLNAFDVFHQHIEDAAYLLKTQREIKLIGEMAKSDLFVEKYGKIGQILTLDWLDTVARQGRLGGFRHTPWLDSLRTRTSAGVIGFRLASNLVHASNIALAMHRTGGPKYWSAGLMEALSGPGREFLRQNFAESFARGGGEPALVEAAAKDVSVFGRTIVPRKYVRAGFAVARKIDQLNSQATMLGAYFRALEERGLDPRRYRELPVDKAAVARALVLARRAVASPLFKDVPMALSRGALTGGNVSFGRSLMQFQNIFLDQWSNIRHDLWRAGIFERNPKLAAEMVLSLTAMVLAETMIREFSKSAISAVTGYEPKKPEDVNAKIATEAIRRLPFGGQMTTWVLYGETGIPVLDSVMEGAKQPVRAATAKTQAGATRANIRAVGGALQLLGVPGASQATDIISKSAAP